jgi:hypothetical protein
MWLLGVALSMATTPDPADMTIHTEDVDRFYEVFATRDEAGFTRRLRREYLQAGSPGLQKFRRRIGSASALARTVRGSEGYYGRLQAELATVHTLGPKLREVYAGMQAIAPDAVFPDIYLLIGRFTSGGTIADEGILLGGELFGRTEEVDGASLPDWLDEGMKPVTEIEAIVAHELVHYQQDFSDYDRLAQVLEEGSADYFAELLAGRHINAAAHDWGRSHEERVKREFCPTRHAESAGRWLYAPSTEAGVPKDLGYFVGYRIAESYVASQDDRSAALRDLLTVSDADAILDASGWCDGF